MRTFGLYLLHAAVALRGVVCFWDGTPQRWLLAALITHGLLLALSLQMSEPPGARSQETYQTARPEPRPPPAAPALHSRP